MKINVTFWNSHRLSQRFLLISNVTFILVQSLVIQEKIYQNSQFLTLLSIA